VDLEARVLNLSSIFKWFRKDFEIKSGSVIQFIKTYWPPDGAGKITGEDYEIRYTSYDWSLNDLKRRG